MSTYAYMMTFREGKTTNLDSGDGRDITLREYHPAFFEFFLFSFTRKRRISLIFFHVTKPTLKHSFCHSSTVFRLHQPVSRIVRPYLSTSFLASRYFARTTVLYRSLGFSLSRSYSE